MTKAELEAKLDREIAEGKITPEEADDEWQDFMTRGEGRWGWSWQS